MKVSDCFIKNCYYVQVFTSRIGNKPEAQSLKLHLIIIKMNSMGIFVKKLMI
jgi:hypothetical protein